MLTFEFLFRDSAGTGQGGFDLGDISVIGELGTHSSAYRTPDQSMMLALSIVGLCDGFRRLLSQPGPGTFEFVGVDSSFRVIFRRTRQGLIEVHGGNRLLHVAEPSLLKHDIERCVMSFAENPDFDERLNAAERADLQSGIQSLRKCRSD